MTCPTCNTPIAEHPAGQCLDALVAERVMGWKRLKGDFWRTPEGLRYCRVDRYSTDPDAMVELWEKLLGLARVNIYGSSVGTFTCEVIPPGDVGWVNVEAPTPMLALARAAVDYDSDGDVDLDDFGLWQRE